MTKGQSVVTILLGLGLAAGVRAQNVGRRGLVARGDSQQGQRAQPATEDSAYTVGPNDVLMINVWHEPDLSVTVPVRPDGRISIPLVNDVQASGLTPIQLAASIGSLLRKYVKDPQVTVIVAQMNSQRVYVLGEVTRPGPISLVPRMTVLQALSIAGGLTQFANEKQIHVLRNENGKQTRYAFNYKEAVRGGGPKQDIILKPGDTIIVQ